MLKPININYYDCVELKIKDNNRGLRTFIMCVDIKELIGCLNPCREGNPRDTKLTTIPCKAMIQCLNEESDKFRERNNGLYVMCSDIKLDNNICTLYMDTEKLDGLSNGGHTLDICELFAKEHPDTSAQVIVRIEVGNRSREDHIKVSNSTNTQDKVKDFSLINLTGDFDNLKNIIKGSKYEDLIAFKQNEKREDPIKHKLVNKPLDVISALQLLALNCPKIYSHKTDAEGNLKKVVSIYNSFDWHRLYEDEKTNLLFKEAENKAIQCFDNYVYLAENIKQYFDKGFLNYCPDGNEYEYANIKYDNQKLAQLRAANKKYDQKLWEFKWGDTKLNHYTDTCYLYPLFYGVNAALDDYNNLGAINSKMNYIEFFEKYGDKYVFKSLYYLLANDGKKRQKPTPLGKDEDFYRYCYEVAFNKCLLKFE